MSILDRYTILESELISDINMTAQTMINTGNNLRIIKLTPLDPDYNESTFNIAFLTPPENSTGLPHITEHSVLCGSKHFNLKEPFQVLQQQSLQTYLNATTYAGHTVYPFVTRNQQDYFNIMEVYLDAVFNPRIHVDENIFKQEGHHLEIENGKLKETGVVLNEMKGSYSDPLKSGITKIQQQMFKDGSMAHLSGGVPEEIVKSTAQQLKQFHQKHYTTDNAVLILISKFQLEKELEIVEIYTQSAFRGYITPIVKQQQILHQKLTINSSLMQQTNTIMNGYRLYDMDKINTIEFVAHNILDSVIHNSPGSLFKNRLGCSVQSVLNSNQAQAYLILIINGSKSSTNDIQNTINQIYEELSEQSDYINYSTLMASLNKYEFRYKEIQDNQGLQISQNIFKSLLFGGEYKKLLTQQEAIKQLKSMKPEEFVQYFRNLIKQYYQPQIQVEMIPVVGLADRKHEQEAKEFEERLAKMTEEEKQQIIKEQEEIQNRQKVPNDPEELKKVGKLKEKDLTNIGDQIKNLEGHLKTVDQFSFYEFDTNSAGICNMRICFDMSANSNTETLSYAALAVRVLTHVRTQKCETLQQINQQIDNLMGSLLTSLQIDDTCNGARVLLNISTKFLVDLSEQVLDFILDVINTSINFLTASEFTKIVNDFALELGNSLKSKSGYELASNRAMAQYSSASASVDYINGIQMLKFLKAGPQIEKVQSFFANIMNTFPVLFCVGAHKSQFMYLEETIARIFSSFRHESRLFSKMPIIRSQLAAQHQNSISAPINANYVAVTYDHHEKFSSSAVMLSDAILSKSYLWDNIRILGGAYGCFLQTSLNMQQYLVSYRDPNIQKTFDVYCQIPSFIKNLCLTESELLSFKIGALSQRQKSLVPQQRFNSSVNYFLENVDVRKYAELVNGIINVTVEELRQTAEIYQKLVNGNKVVVGRANDVKKWALDNSMEYEEV
ncbi:Insulinase [Hexamita inflata]|uniref:Insulinase n=1 Tax=Hexamita inflata TaxID=28002 RepID=A0ABP1K259_9EUKA